MVESVGIETDLVHIITKTVVTAFQLFLVENLIIALQHKEIQNSV